MCLVKVHNLLVRLVQKEAPLVEKIQKIAYRLLIIITRYLPMVYLLCEAFVYTMRLNGHDMFWLINTCSFSFLAFFMLLVMSFALQFCLYHRLAIYSLMLTEILSYIDTQDNDIFIYTNTYIVWALLIFILFILFIYLFYGKRIVTNKTSQYGMLK